MFSNMRIVGELRAFVNGKLGSFVIREWFMIAFSRTRPRLKIEVAAAMSEPCLTENIFCEDENIIFLVGKTDIEFLPN